MHAGAGPLFIALALQFGALARQLHEHAPAFVPAAGPAAARASASSQQACFDCGQHVFSSRQRPLQSSGTSGVSFWQDCSIYASLEPPRHLLSDDVQLVNVSQAADGKRGLARGREDAGPRSSNDAHPHTHKPLLPLNSRDYVGLALASFALFVAAGGGLGGGGILVPVLLVVLGEPSRTARGHPIPHMHR